MAGDPLSSIGLGAPLDADADHPRATYAYLVQVSRDGSVWIADRAEPSGGIEVSVLSALEVARQVLRRRFVQLRADDSAHWSDHWFRVDVWTVERSRKADTGDAGAGATGAGATGAEVPAGWALSGRHLQTRGIAPDVVEVRTPSQVRCQVGGCQVGR
ncbi:hypothetical protein ThrDRAFT_01831 [Frankia casuarinae]|jgi:hypothetical protein|uniref:Uncharacterized protein n=1 Tax=Frankia casuarinae (strain DSM 45818 / CECT 9043 / HFP020203 / CcI3) TaxID=106370 RepID=Q2J9M7_FRACC|nr:MULTISPECIES: hypothetical protein [Frankia]ABD12015.1 hypothetical protein Francci3_2653 [Frankia casuarinae]EYT92548.1 hypothetical protein ThrDRAFT_01831 [Frankia casuarinae]KDA43067.1 hypothetical protein BMG523Draft_02122 [Frankia sp. BMG5.23]KEZ36449.1 hypothetical protein CEDDRAFT_02137 [Frankia sp. CeD]ORT53274.1 hypothetical protein KBI5_07475 [Frankia sp. KB5]